MDNDFHVKIEGGYLEHEVQEKDNRYQPLRSKLNDLEREVMVLRAKNEELQLRIVSIERDRQANSKDKSPMNDEKMDSDEYSVRALVCEKQNAEREVDIWKHKYKELESLLLVPQGSSGLDSKQLTSIKEVEELVNVGNISAAVIQDGEIHCVKYKHGVQVINLDGDETALSTPAGARPTFQSAETIHNSKNQNNEDDTSDCNEKIPSVVTSKRKRSINVVTSDTESDDDDNMPIGQFVRKRFPQLVPQPAVSDCDVGADFSTRKKKRLVKLNQKNGGQRTERNNESENNDDDTLGDFIESSSDESESEEEASDDVAQEYSDSSDDYVRIIDRIRRTKDHGFEWELEADMLADIGKDDMLCLRAVCALYRRQTCNEQELHGLFDPNRSGRGFNMLDAHWGAKLAVFLTDGDTEGDVTRSVEQLIAFNPGGLELCRKFAARYSKQLFAMYNDREDPYFRPP